MTNFAGPLLWYIEEKQKRKNMSVKNKATQLYNEGLIIAKHYTFPHAEHGLAKEIALHSIKVAKEHADSNLKGWLDADVLAFLESVEQEIKSM